MANPIERSVNYLGSVVNRTIGRAAWMEAMARPTPSKAVPDEYRPAWARGINRVLDKGAPTDAIVQAVFPFYSRITTPIVNHPERFKHINPLVVDSGCIVPMVADLASIVAGVYLSNNLGELGQFWMIRNAATHVGLDLAGAAVNKIKHLKSPVALTLI